MDSLHVTLALLLSLAAAAAAWLLRERGRLTAERARMSMEAAHQTQEHARLQAERDVAQARLSDSEAMKTGFQAVAGEVLRNSTSEFLKLAKESLGAKEASAVAQLDQRKTAVEGLIQPLQKAIQETRDQLAKTAADSASLREHVLRVTVSNKELQAETGRLTQALRKPNVRGRYGEIQLERVVELAGMRSYCDFTTQEALRDSHGKLQKPDLVVRLPNGRVVAIDAKMPLDAYMDAVATEDTDKRNERLERYAQNVAEQVQKLARREYWANFEDSPELVVMFMPGDQLVDAALERRPDLIEIAAQQNVVLASPSTLIGLLRAIHVGWRERNLTENAEELFRLGRELHQRMAIVLERASKLGDSLDGARKNYNLFVGSVETRLIPTMRKFEEKDARSTKDIIVPRKIEGDVRSIAPLDVADDPAIPSKG